MKLINTILTFLDIVIVILSYTISNIVVWHKKNLSNVWFYVFIVFTIVNLFELLGSLTLFLYNPLNLLVENEIQKIKTFPRRVLLNVLSLIIIIMSVIIIINNRKMSAKYYKYFGLVNTLYFVLNIFFSAL